MRDKACALRKYAHDAVFDVKVTEGGDIQRIHMRNSTLHHGEMESCIMRALVSLPIPMSLLALRSSGPVSGGEAVDREHVGIVQALPALGPIMVIAAGVTLAVYVAVAVNDDVLNAAKRTKKIDQLCDPPFHDCLGNNKQPNWNIEDFGGEKDCLSCLWECRDKKGIWPDYKCPRPGYRPNYVKMEPQMNSSSNDISVTCWSCKKRPATTRYTNRRGKLSELVCQPCLDLLQMQEDFGWGIYDRRELDEQERYDEILAWLDEFEEANRHRDQDGWLKRAVTCHRELVLWQAGRYDEAMKACDIIQQLGFRDITDRWSLASARARNFEGLERHADALAVFEDAFREQDPRYLAGARYWMTSLVDLSKNAGKPVDESWREVVQNVANEFEVEVPVRPTLGETILALFELTEGKPSKRQREWEKKQAAEEGLSGDKANDPPK